MGKSGGGPMCGIGMARRGVETGGREVGEGGANGIAECAGYIGADGFEFSPEIGFGAAGGGGQGSEANGDGASSQGVVRIPTLGGGDEDRALDIKGERLARVALFVKEEGGTGGEAAERGGKARANGTGVVEGEDPRVLSDGEQLAGRVGKGKQRSNRGVDEGAEHAGSGGLAAGGRTIENKNRMRTGRA
jgi:hypothetical protein